MIEAAQLNSRLSALGIGPITDAVIRQLPTGLTLERIGHALAQAEQGQQGALVYLRKNLPSAGRETPATRAKNRPAADDAIPSARNRAPADRRRLHIYGGKAALCVETDATRQDEPTLRVEAAQAVAARQFDWQNKIVIQLTRAELPLFSATVLGLIPRCTCNNHGPENNKGLEILHQGDKLFVRVYQKDQAPRAVPVDAADSFHLAALCLRQLRAGARWLTDQGVIAALKLTVQRMAQAPERA